MPWARKSKAMRLKEKPGRGSVRAVQVDRCAIPQPGLLGEVCHGGFGVHGLIARTNLVLDEPPHELSPRAVAFPLDSAHNDSLVGRLHVEGPIHGFLFGRDASFDGSACGQWGCRGGGGGRAGDVCRPLVRGVDAIAGNSSARIAKVGHFPLGGRSARRIDAVEREGWAVVGGNRRRSGRVWWFEFVRGRQNFVEKKTSHTGPRLCARMFGPETEPGAAVVGGQWLCGL